VTASDVWVLVGVFALIGLWIWAATHDDFD
jgi:hypothetical protein